MRSALAAAGLAALSSPSCSKAPRPPDIVILFADDLGWADVGYHHCDTSGTIVTPEIDALAQKGLRLERFRTAPLCTPSRAGLLTARSPLRDGLLRNIDAMHTSGLPLGEEILPAAFARAGYRTAMVGKWHLGHAIPEQWPNARGFESFYGFHGGWIDYQTHARGSMDDWWRDAQPVSETGYATHLLTQEAVKILSERGRTRPLLLYVAFNAPHTPLHVPPGRALDAESTQDKARGAYALMVSELDGSIGRILRTIESGERASETIVFFASDNGAAPHGGGSSAPLRGEKFTPFEGGIRTPAILAWPGHVGAGECDRSVTHLDVLPTLAGLAGVHLDPARELDGRNLWPQLVASAEVPRDAVAFGCEDKGERRYALVDERWKLVETLGAGAPAPVDLLFDVTADPREEHDLASEQPERLSRMRALLEPWAAMPEQDAPAPR